MQRERTTALCFLGLTVGACQWVGGVEERYSARYLADAGTPHSEAGGGGGAGGFAGSAGDAGSADDAGAGGAAGMAGAAGAAGADPDGGCTEGDERTCYTGPDWARGVGACSEGTESCSAGSWGICSGSILPAHEDCSTVDDEDCDGHASCTGAALWAVRFGGLGGDSIRGIDIAPSGDIYVTGVYSGVVQIGQTVLDGGAGLNAFLARLDERGNPVWARGFPSPSHQESWNKLRVASDGVYLGGMFVGTVDFGDGPSQAAGQYSAFLARYDLDGNHIWTKTFGTDGSHAISGMGLNEEGGVTVGGYFNQSMSIDTAALEANGGWDMFLLSFTPGGQLRWLRSFGASGTEVMEGMDIASDGRVFAQVTVSEAADLGTGILPGTNVNDVALAAYQPNGTPLWAKRFGDGHQRSNQVFVSSDGTVLICGVNVSGAVDFGGGPLSGRGNYLARFSAEGEHVRSTIFNEGQDHAAVREDGQGNVLFTGGITGPADFGDGPLPHAGGLDIFALKMDHDFNVLWSFHTGGTGNDFAHTAIADPLDRVVVTGTFQNQITIGTTTLKSAGDFDLFLAMLSP